MPYSQGTAVKTDADKFIFDNVQHIMQESTEIGPARRPPSKVGIRSCDVYCKSCGHAWRARDGDKTLRNVIGGIGVECPQCRAEEGPIKLP